LNADKKSFIMFGLFVDHVFINTQSCNISDPDIINIHIVISLLGERF